MIWIAEKGSGLKKIDETVRDTPPFHFIYMKGIAGTIITSSMI